MLMVSDNTLADQLSRMVSVVSGFDGSSASVNTAYQAVLKRYGIPVDGMTFRDGSGLSDLNAVTTTYLAQFMQKVRAGEGSLGIILSGLPISGQTGTLSWRFTGDNAVATGAVIAKTGMLERERAMGGIINAQDGTPLTFAVYAMGTASRMTPRMRSTPSSPRPSSAATTSPTSDARPDHRRRPERLHRGWGARRRGRHRGRRGHRTTARRQRRSLRPRDRPRATGTTATTTTAATSTRSPTSSTPGPSTASQRTEGAEYHASPRGRGRRARAQGQGKPAYSMFEGTTDRGESVPQMLDRYGVLELEIAGIATDYCVRATALDALATGRKVTVLSDPS